MNTRGDARDNAKRHLAAMGYLNDPVSGRYDPWLHLGLDGAFPGVRFRFSANLPEGISGLTNFNQGTVVLATGLGAGQIRSTVAHEIVHLERGGLHSLLEEDLQPFEEKLCELVAVSRLVATEDLHGLSERVSREGAEAVAEALVIDESMVEVALQLEATAELMLAKDIGASGEWRDEDEIRQAARA